MVLSSEKGEPDIIIEHPAGFLRVDAETKEKRIMLTIDHFIRPKEWVSDY